MQRQASEPRLCESARAAPSQYSLRKRRHTRMLRSNVALSRIMRHCSASLNNLRRVFCLISCTDAFGCSCRVGEDRRKSSRMGVHLLVRLSILEPALYCLGISTTGATESARQCPASSRRSCAGGSRRNRPLVVDQTQAFVTLHLCSCACGLFIN